MKNTLLSICACIAALPSFAQLSLGPTAGVHSSIQALTALNRRSEYVNTAWRAGAAAAIKCSKHFSLRPAIMYERYDELLTAVGASCLAAYSMPIKGGGAFFAGAGPYVAITAGRSRFDIPGIRGKGVAKLMRPFNPGIAVNAGCQLKNGIFAAIYFQRIIPDVLIKGVFDMPGIPSPPDLKMNYYNYGLSAGYLFKLSNKKKTPPEKK